MVDISDKNADHNLEFVCQILYFYIANHNLNKKSVKLSFDPILALLLSICTPIASNNRPIPFFNKKIIEASVKLGHKSSWI